MYVVSSVETNCTWNDVTYYDGVSNIITIGIMGMAGTDARRLLLDIKAKSSTLWDQIVSGAPQLADDCENAPDTWEWWSTRSLSKGEGETVASVLGSDEGHSIQTQNWSDICNEYIDIAIGRGMSLDNAASMVFFMTMYHQSPASSFVVLNNAGSNADLYKLYTNCLNNGIFSNYPNRYNEAYDLLKDWDGESSPPDFGQNSDDINPGGDNEPPIGEIASKLGYILQHGDCLFLYGKNEYAGGVMFVPAGGQRWINGYNADGTTIGGGNTGGGDYNADNAGTVDWCRQYLHQWRYIYGGDRYNPQDTGGTDCSGMTHAAYWHVRGIEIGGWTGAQYTSDASETIYEGNGDWGNVPWDRMAAGDLMLMSETSSQFVAGSTSHVGLYTGEPNMIIHVDRDGSPNEEDITERYHGVAICIRRPK